MDDSERDERESTAETDDIAHIRSFDPAAGIDAPASLRERVAGIAASHADEVDSDAAATGAPVPIRRKRPWLAPVAAAAALAVGVGGGYLFGSGAFAFTPAQGIPESLGVPVEIGTAENPAPPVSLGGADYGVQAMSAIAESGSDASGMILNDAQFTPGSSEAQQNSTVDQWHYSNNRRFTVPTFDTGPETATVYALDGRAHFSAEDAQRMADLLGVEGEAYQQEEYTYGWQVDTRKAITSTLSLTPTGDGNVWASTTNPDPWSACDREIAPTYDLQNYDEARYAAYSAEVEACVAATPMPTEQQARDALSLFLTATGVDESSTEIELDVFEEGRTISATASWVVDGNVTVIHSFVTVSHLGLLHASGPTATVESLGEYSIVTPDEAAARLNDPVYAPQWSSEQAQEITYEGEMPTEPPALPTAGTPVPWGISEFEIESARLGLALMTGTKDERFLAPAYEFTDTDGNVWSVIALAESELDTLGGGATGGGWWGPLF